MIELFLSDSQQRMIVNRIIAGINHYNEEKQRQRKNLYEPYMKMRSEHDLTAYVLSEFSPNKNAIEGLLHRDITYGIDMTLPELVSKSAVVQIYNEGSKLKNNLINSRCFEYNSSPTNRPYFIVISFCVDKMKVLKNIKAVFFDSNKSVMCKENMYTRPNLNLKTG